MDASLLLAARIGSLEQSRNRYRRAVGALALAVALLCAVAMVPQAQEELRAQRLLLVHSDAANAGTGVVLLAGPGGSLLIQTTDGTEIARIGGPAARHIRQ